MNNTYLILTRNDDASRAALSNYGAELAASGQDPLFMCWVWRNVPEADFVAAQADLGFLASVVVDHGSSPADASE